MCNFNLNLQVGCVAQRGDRFSALCVHDRPPLSLSTTEFVHEGHSQEVSSMNDSVAMPQDGLRGREERRGRRGLATQPPALSLEGAGVQRTKQAFMESTLSTRA